MQAAKKQRSREVRRCVLALLWCVPLILTGCVKHAVVVAGKKVPFPPPEVTSPLADIASSGLREPWLRYQNASIDPRIAEVPGAIEEGLKSDPGRYLPELVAFLMDGAEDDFHAVKRLHDWVADHIAYDTKSFFADITPPGGVGIENVLKRGSSVCSGYARLFQAMARQAGFPAEVVPGYSRQAWGATDSDPFVEEDSLKPNHAWNAVQIQGQHYLLDTTWDAGWVSKAGGFTKRYKTEYLFVPPARALETRYPTDASWQLLERPLSEAEFRALPFAKNRVFAFDLKLLTPLDRVTAVESTTRVRVSVPEGKLLLAKLQGKDGKEHAQTTLIEAGEGSADILVVFPEPGQWSLSLWVGSATKHRSYTRYEYSLSTRFEFNASEGSAVRFPE
jgi:hypothetical protein